MKFYRDINIPKVFFINEISSIFFFTDFLFSRIRSFDSYIFSFLVSAERWVNFLFIFN